MKVFVFDSKKCNGCHSCQIACKDEHVGNEWMPYAKAQPNTGQFWLRVEQIEHGQGPMVRMEYTPWLCMHCSNCSASRSCKESAFVRREDGLTYIDPAKCSGCSVCTDLCPYGAVFFNTETRIAQKCTGCAHLVEKGELPHCVDLCAMGALRFGDYEDLVGELSDAETLLPEANTKPRVFYRNMPHLFLGGEVWDPFENEVIANASVRLTLPNGECVLHQTDDFGDFQFTCLDKGRYGLSISAEGYASVTGITVELNKSQYLGDFPLTRVRDPTRQRPTTRQFG